MRLQTSMQSCSFAVRLCNKVISVMPCCGHFSSFLSEYITFFNAFENVEQRYLFDLQGTDPSLD